MDITDAQLQSWIQGALFPLARIGGLFSSAPVIGDRSAPVRVRMMLALALLLIVMPLLPETPPLTAFTADWWLRIVLEMAVGIAMGFVFRLVFEAVILGGDLIGNGMGLGFARMADPLRGTDVPVIGQFLQLMCALLFVSMGGHLHLIEMLVDSFRTIPDPARAFEAGHFSTLAGLGSLMFSGALTLALPMLAALMLVNLAFGVMSRSSPTLNGMSVGFPLALLMGLLLLGINLPGLRVVFEKLIVEATEVVGALFGAGGFDGR
jgi:flagellar biosynthetic protein FliR